MCVSHGADQQILCHHSRLFLAVMCSDQIHVFTIRQKRCFSARLQTKVHVDHGMCRNFDMTAHSISGQKCVRKRSQEAEGNRSERGKRKGYAFRQCAKEKAKGHLGVQDTKLMQSLHHLLVINVASIVPPAHQSHSDVILLCVIQVSVIQVSVIQVSVILVCVILVATCMPGNMLTVSVHWMNGNRTIAIHIDTRISAV